jgi:hypothetical protein
MKEYFEPIEYQPPQMGAEATRLWNECLEREWRRTHLKSSDDCPEGTKLVKQGKDCKCVEINPPK